MATEDAASVHGVAEAENSSLVAHDQAPSLCSLQVDDGHDRGAHAAMRPARTKSRLELESPPVPQGLHAASHLVDDSSPLLQRQHELAVATPSTDPAAPCVATLADFESTATPDAAVKEMRAKGLVTSSNPLVPPQAEACVPVSPSPNPGAEAITSYIPPSRIGGGTSPDGKMLFGRNVAQRQRNLANTNALTEYEADLTSKDRAKQKAAVRKFLEENIESDWEWEWPQTSTKRRTLREQMQANAERWKERDEWLSNTNDSDDDPAMPTTASPDTASMSDFKFETPDGVGETIKKREDDRKQRRKRKLEEEMAYNDGLRCFTSRRDAWTGARQVAVVTPTSTNELTPTTSDAQPEKKDGDGIEIERETTNHEEMVSIPDIEIPIAPPLLPPTNAMRASITPSAYNTIYDKVILQSLAPSCPMNLQDVISSCVQGWKRDGEWPPKSTPLPPSVAAAKKKGRKLSVASIFGLDKHERDAKDKEKEARENGQSGIRRSFHRILGLGHGTKEAVARERAHTNGTVDKGKEGDPVAIS